MATNLPDMKVNVNANAQGKTITDILAEADVIYGKWKQMCKERNVNLKYFFTSGELDLDYKKMGKKMQGFYKSVDEIFSILQKEHYDFAIAYPIQLRYMCQLGKYHRKALEIYLKKIALNPWKSEEEYIDAQAYYTKVLYMKMNRHWTQAELEQEYNKTKDILTKERKVFKNMVDNYEKEVNEEEKQADAARVSEMKKLLKEKLKERLDQLEKINK